MTTEAKPAPPVGDARLDLALAIISHEIRTPLTAAAAGLHLLGNDRLTSEQRRETSELVVRQLQLLTQLADDVLDGASVALGKLSLSREPVDLRKLATSIAAEYDAVVVADGDPCVANVDPRRLGQILGNLLGNARRHGVADVRVDASVDGIDGQAVVTITNHLRHPISMDAAISWFEPFARGDRSTGHGLGLYVVRALVVAHGGTLGVDSLACDSCAVGQDLKIWLRLPLAGPDLVPSPRPAPRSDGDQSDD